MKFLNLSILVSLTASLLVGQTALAAGLIMVDPLAGAASAIAMIPILPPNPVHPPVHPLQPLRPVRPPLLKGQVAFGLHLQSESIKVDINDQIAKTYISQTFINDTDRNLAGTYLFPLPDDTTFSSFSLHIDGKPVEGKILEANEARQQFEEIVRRMVDPGLLEYADYKTVRARIFPIPAHGTKKVELEYTQILRAENGMLKYRFPLKSEGQSAPVDEIKLDVKLVSKQGVRTIWSPSHTINSTRTDDHNAKIAFLSHDTVPDKDFLLYYSVSDKDLAASLITHKNDDEDGYFLLTLTPPVQSKTVIGKDIVLVADTSGSMQGNKMTQCKRALKYVVNALNASDRFNIVQFNTDVERFRSQLQPASAENKKVALDFIEELEARGGTNIGDALKSGAAILNQTSVRPAYLVLMTDGEPTVGETDIPKLLKLANSERDLRVFDFGVGYDVNTRLLNKLSEEHHGTTQYVEPDEDIESALSAFYQKIKSPVLSNVRLAYQGIQVKDIYPREVKDIFAGSQLLLMGRYKNSGKATLQLTGTVNGDSKAYSFPLDFASEAAGHTYLPRLWAMRRIGHLTDIAQENNGNREVVDEIVALSKKYGIISAYTSFLVTDPSENHRLANAPALPMVRESRSDWMSGTTSGVRGNLFKAPHSMQIVDARALSMAAPQAAGGGSGAMSYGAADQVSGKAAVLRSKRAAEYQHSEIASSERLDKNNGIKTVEDKTFYLKDGFWTDSTVDAKSPKPEVIAFGSQPYFDLLHKLPGISKYLSIGRQVILLFQGHCYKVTSSSPVTS